ncbi:hypothetical protein SMMN14_08392 [Sphaerulina musiva]
MVDQDSTVEAREPLAREIELYTEEELARYLEENGPTVSVQDPKNVSAEFVQRLRDISNRPRTSCALNLDQVNALLQSMPTTTPDLFRNSPSPATTASPLPQEEEDAECLRSETEAYHTLVHDGVHPPYPFHLLESFLWNPEQYLEHEEYGDIVYFWREHVGNKAERTCICASQLSRWRTFRIVQNRIRERGVISESVLRHAAEWATMFSLEDYVERHGSIDGQWDFKEYAERLTRRLSKYGFTRPFQLERNLARQDKLTTWIEYLGYEYWSYNYAATFVKRSQRQHDKGWKKLVDSNLLQPEETYDVICDINTSIRHANEEERAEKAVQSATAAVSLTESTIARSDGSTTKLRQRLLAEQATLNAARGSLESIKMRNDAITDFLYAIREYRCQKDEARRYSALLRWIVRQIPTIELELNLPNNVEDDPDRIQRLPETIEGQHSQEYLGTHAVGDKQSDSVQGAPSISSSLIPQSHKRRRSSFNNEPVSKRHKASPEEIVASSSAPNASPSVTARPATETRTTPGLETSKAPSGDSSRPLKPLRRSARIAQLATETKTTPGLGVSKIPSGDSSRPLKPLRRSARIAEIARKKAMSIETRIAPVEPRRSGKSTSVSVPRGSGRRRGRRRGAVGRVIRS